MSLYTEGTYLGVGNWVLQNSARTSRRRVVVAFSPEQSHAGARVLLVADPRLPLPQAWLWYLALLSFSLLSPVSLVHALSTLSLAVSNTKPRACTQTLLQNRPIELSVKDWESPRVLPTPRNAP